MDIYHLHTQEILERISRHCPEALSSYLVCINRMQPNGDVFFSKDDVEVGMSLSMRSFRNHIKKLARENLLSWAPLDSGIAINIMDNHEDDGI